MAVNPEGACANMSCPGTTQVPLLRPLVHVTVSCQARAAARACWSVSKLGTVLAWATSCVASLRTSGP